MLSVVTHKSCQILPLRGVYAVPLTPRTLFWNSPDGEAPRVSVRGNPNPKPKPNPNPNPSPNATKELGGCESHLFRRDTSHRKD